MLIYEIEMLADEIVDIKEALSVAASGGLAANHDFGSGINRARAAAVIPN